MSSDIINDISLLTRKSCLSKLQLLQAGDRAAVGPASKTESHQKRSKKHFLSPLSDNLPAHVDNVRLALPSSLAICLLCNTLPAVNHSFG